MSSYTGIPSSGPLKYIGPNVALVSIVSRNRSPTSADIRQGTTGQYYPIGSLWIVSKNPTTGLEGDFWWLSKIVANVAYWIMIGGSTGTTPIDSVQVDGATAPGTNPVLPDANGLITVTGAQVAPGAIGANVIKMQSLAANSYTAQIQQTSVVASKDTTKNGVAHFNSANFTNDQGFISLSGGSGIYPITPYVVGPIGQAGYQTIQSAINAANTAGGGMVWVQPGTYTENLTFFSGIQISGSSEQSATIIGVHTPPSSGTLNIDRLSFQSATHIFSSTAAGTTAIIMEDCSVNATNGYTFNLPNFTGSASVAVFNIGNFGTSDGFINNTGGCQFYAFAAGIGNGTGNPMILSGPAVFANQIVIGCPVNLVTGAALSSYGSAYTATLTASNNSTAVLNADNFVTGATPAITQSSSGSLKLNSVTINSSNNPVISGAGAGIITLGGVVFVDGKNIAGTLTLAGSSGFTASNLTNHGVVLGAGALPLNSTSAGTSLQVLQSGGASADPNWSTATYPATTTANDILYSSATNVVGQIATLINGVLITDNSGVPSLLPNSATPGFVLKANSGAPPSWQIDASIGGFTSIVVQTFDSSGTYTPTSGMKYCTSEVQGGGGGGGGVSGSSLNQASVGAGGGGGGYSKKTFSAATIGASQAVTIGAAGSAGASGGGTGGSGGTTSFGALISATGGSGGNWAQNLVNVICKADGGLAGMGSGGDVNVSGTGGSDAFAITDLSSGGQGGSSFYGGDGGSGIAISTSTSEAGGTATSFGGGGGGAASFGFGTSSAQAGGAGLGGYCVITEYI